MNNFKKIGLTALAGSLIATSAFAEMSISGSASIDVKNHEKTQAGKNFSMGNSVTFSASGETDGGLNVSTSFELDQGAGAGGGPFDSHSITVSSDALGKLVFSGHGGDSAQGAIDTTAAGNIWDSTFTYGGANTAFTGPSAAAAGNDSLLYTLPSMVDDVTIMASYSPGRASQDSHTSWAVSYTGVEGLALHFGVGDSGAPGSEVESTTMKGSYAIGSFTLGYSNTDNDKTGASNREITSYALSYTVSDDLSISYGQETFDKQGSAIDEEFEMISVSYTTGGMTLTASSKEADGLNNAAGGENQQGIWSLAASFAF
jgi:outer membrane protein OmpU